MSRARRPRASARGAAPVFAALGDETRLAVVARLGTAGPLSIARLSAGAGVTRQAITKHLRVLADAGLVHESRQGRESIWRLEPAGLDEARRRLAQISAQWTESLDRIKAHLEAEAPGAPRPEPPPVL